MLRQNINLFLVFFMLVANSFAAIRTEEDKGIIVLMDGRFLETKYAESMPKHWFKNSPHELVSSSILSDISAFWNLNSGAADGE